jgi:MoxR-like ATPase
MKFSAAAAALAAYVSADIPAFLWGPPGVGKSDMVRQTADAAGLPLIDVRAVLLDPVDLRGLPAVVDGRAVWTPPVFLPDADRDGESGILFLDELNAAPPSVQAACFQLVLNRAVGEYKLPAGWRVVAAGNRAADRAAAQRMPSALANRFGHLDVEPDADAWQAWAAAAGLAPVVRAFLRLRPALLAPADFAKAADVRAFPTPRSWSAVARIAGAADAVRLHLVSGLVGEAAGAEFEGFVRVWRSIPDPRSVFADPDGAPVPSDPAALYAVTTALAYLADRQTFGAALRYASRLPREYAVLTAVDAVRRAPDLAETHAFATWSAAHADVTI